jgi:hypothetical protein
MIVMAKKKKSDAAGPFPSRKRVKYAGIRLEVYDALEAAGTPFERSISYMATLGGKLILAWMEKNPGLPPDMALQQIAKPSE